MCTCFMSHLLVLVFGLGLERAGLGLGLEGVCLGLGLVTASLDYNTNV